MDQWLEEHGLLDLKKFVEETLGVVDQDDLREIDVPMLRRACDDGSLRPIAMKKLCRALGLSLEDGSESEARTKELKDESEGCQEPSSMLDRSGTREQNLSQNKKIIHALEAFEKKASVDVAFLIDGTGSMEPYIVKVNTDIQGLVNHIKEIYPNMLVRVGMVVYRDYGDGSKRTETFHLTPDLSSFTRFVSSQTAFGGGGDGPEDVAGGLAAIRHLKWKGAHRLLLHVGDAPPHGLKYYPGGSQNDKYPGGDPRGLIPEQLALELQKLNVVYLFGEICYKTRKMVAIFQATCKSSKYPEDWPLNGPGDMFGKLTSTTTSALSKSLSLSASVADDGKKRLMDLDTAVPKYWQTAHGKAWCFRSLESLDELIDETYDVKHILLDPVPVNYSVGPLPFAQGSCQFAFYARDEYHKLWVHKTTRWLGAKNQMMPAYVDGLSIIRAASFLARQFSIALMSTSTSITVRVVESRLIQYSAVSDPATFALEEPLISGDWHKFNSNHGYVFTEEDHPVMQSFSHWTYQATDKNCMVVDLQGIFDRSEQEYVLSDPAIHCIDGLRFHPTNMSARGIKKFFESHTCNNICSLLKLKA